jgi:hypothetical protein
MFLICAAIDALVPELWRNDRFWRSVLAVRGRWRSSDGGGRLPGCSCLDASCLPLAFRFAVAAAFFAALASWFALAPVNSVLSTWTPGPAPGISGAIRWRWETGHMVVASIKLAAFGASSAPALDSAAVRATSLCCAAGSAEAG